MIKLNDTVRINTEVTLYGERHEYITEDGLFTLEVEDIFEDEGILYIAAEATAVANGMVGHIEVPGELITVNA